MDWTATTHLVYLAVALPVTVWVARTLLVNGTAFLTDVYEGRAQLAGSVNRLMVVGFYLLNIGFVLLLVRVGGEVRGFADMLETLSGKLGVVLLVLGVVHLANVHTFNSIRKRRNEERVRRAEAAPWRAGSAVEEAVDQAVADRVAERPVTDRGRIDDGYDPFPARGR
ncbi:hypothetical protein ACOACO_13165 [Nocardioides sp. CPCC 205120]|uniref:hypothetical protein n=1 Tax=Nocardioides sp. CPCC 205120 TaxID=3406462 RepID=UPI003B5047C1